MSRTDDAEALSSLYRKALEMIRDQPDVARDANGKPKFGGGDWIDWAKGRARQALSQERKV